MWRRLRSDCSEFAGGDARARAEGGERELERFVLCGGAASGGRRWHSRRVERVSNRSSVGQPLLALT